MAHAGGRPSSYTQEMADEICAELSIGKSLRTVCAASDRPAIATIFNWFRNYPEFLAQYEKAKAESADMLIEDMQDIADNIAGDTQRDRLRVDTRKWVASKLKPKKYGEKMDLTSDGKQLPIPILAGIIKPHEDQGTDKSIQ